MRGVPGVEENQEEEKKVPQEEGSTRGGKEGCSKVKNKTRWRGKSQEEEEGKEGKEGRKERA